LSAKEEGRLIEIEKVDDENSVHIDVDDKIVVLETIVDGQQKYRFFEKYRLNSLYLLLGLFVLLTVLIAGWRGISSLFGLGVSLLVLVCWVIPKIVAGANPLLVAFIGSFVIVTVSIFLSHGFKKRTLLACIATIITLLLALLMSVLAVDYAGLLGMGSEEAVSLTFSNLADIDLKGLLLAAIIIGVLGVLDDVTTAQAAVVEELYLANKKLKFSSLYKRAMSVGKEHIASMINTLVIAYVGASLPIFLFIVMSENPTWVVLNNEFMAEEIVRSLVGSAALVLAVPITTLLVSYVYSSGKR